MSKDIEALIFDFDGVLADTEPLYWRSWAELLGTYGIPLSWDSYERYGRGATDRQMLMSLPEMAQHRHLVPELQQQTQSRRQRVGQWCAEQSPICSATVIRLLDLKEYRLGLVTSSSRDEVTPILRAAGIFDQFHALVFGDDVVLHKPDPAPYLLIRERLGIETGLAFEDSDPGIASATGAGLTAVRVTNPRDLAAIVDATLAAR